MAVGSQYVMIAGALTPLRRNYNKAGVYIFSRSHLYGASFFPKILFYYLGGAEGQSPL